jgi:acetyl-CoA carboxylase biotin carboxylase subunit
MMGDKITAKKPPSGSAFRSFRARGRRLTKRRSQAIAADIGYPVIIKATAGGGGRGMKWPSRSRELVALSHRALRSQAGLRQ